MASKYHEDWQSSKTTVLQRNMYMFNKELMSDISFTCGESSRVFFAHKYVLATSSAVFFALFYGDMAQKESSICIPDTDDESFEQFLRFLYTDDCKITVENAIGVMYLAKKYFISSLAEKCCNVLGESIEPDNVFIVLEQAIKFDEKELEEKCWVIISLTTRQALNSKGFLSIGSQTLHALLTKDKLEILEIELFKKVLTWVDNECGRQGVEIQETDPTRRRILGDSVYELRFLAMSQQEFAEYVLPTGVLTDSEIISIFKEFNGIEVRGLKWKEQKRRQGIITHFNRFDPAKICDGWGYTGNSDALILIVNKPVLLHGVRLLGDKNGSEYKVVFKVENEIVESCYTSEKDSDNVWGYDVMLPKPVSLLPAEEVTMTAIISGPQSLKGNAGKSSVKVNDIVASFIKSSVSVNGTDVIRGQFYKVFLSEM